MFCLVLTSDRLCVISPPRYLISDHSHVPLTSVSGTLHTPWPLICHPSASSQEFQSQKSCQFLHSKTKLVSLFRVTNAYGTRECLFTQKLFRNENWALCFTLLTSCVTIFLLFPSQSHLHWFFKIQLKYGQDCCNFLLEDSYGHWSLLIPWQQISPLHVSQYWRWMSVSGRWGTEPGRCCPPGPDWLIVKVFPNPRTRLKSVLAVQARLGSHL